MLAKTAKIAGIGTAGTKITAKTAKTAKNHWNRWNRNCIKAGMALAYELYLLFELAGVTKEVISTREKVKAIFLSTAIF